MTIMSNRYKLPQYGSLLAFRLQADSLQVVLLAAVDFVAAVEM